MRLPSRMLVPATAIAMLGTVSVAGGCKSADKSEAQAITLPDLPAPARAAIEREAGAASITDLTTTVDNGKVVYTAEFTRNGQETEVEVFADGTIASIDTAITLADVPPAVLAVAQREAGDLKIIEIDREVAAGVTTYEFDVKGPTRKGEIVIAADARVVSREIKPASK